MLYIYIYIYLFIYIYIYIYIYISSSASNPISGNLKRQLSFRHSFSRAPRNIHTHTCYWLCTTQVRYLDVVSEQTVKWTSTVVVRFVSCLLLPISLSLFALSLFLSFSLSLFLSTVSSSLIIIVKKCIIMQTHLLFWSSVTQQCEGQFMQ